MKQCAAKTHWTSNFVLYFTTAYSTIDDEDASSGKLNNPKAKTPCSGVHLIRLERKINLGQKKTRLSKRNQTYNFKNYKGPTQEQLSTPCLLLCVLALTRTILIKNNKLFSLHVVKILKNNGGQVLLCRHDLRRKKKRQNHQIHPYVRCRAKQARERSWGITIERWVW